MGWFTHYHHHEDSPSAPLGVENQLGWSRTRASASYLAAVEVWADTSARETMIVAIFQGGLYHITSISWFLRFTVSQMHLSEPIHVSLVMVKTRAAPIKCITSLVEALWSPFTGSDIASHERSFSLPLEFCPCMDRWYISTELSQRKHMLIQALCQQSNFSYWRSYSPQSLESCEGNRKSCWLRLRWILPVELANHPLWSTGPDWLQLESHKWPMQMRLSCWWSDRNLSP